MKYSSSARQWGVVFLAFSRILSIFVGKFWKTGACHDAVADLSGGEEGSDGAAAWDFNQKLHQYKLKE